MRRDAVTSEVRESVFRRDRMCVLFRLDPKHACRDTWNQPHSSFALDRMTLEHVHDGYGQMGKRAPSDPEHLVTLCAAANLRPPTKEQRASFRAYLARVAA